MRRVTEEDRPESAQQPVARRQVRRTLASAAQNDELLLEQEVLRHHRSYTSGATELHGYDGEVEQGEQEVPHLRVSVGQTSGAAQRCRILDSAQEFSIRDAQAFVPATDSPWDDEHTSPAVVVTTDRPDPG